jgi:hypothetical protein
VEWPPLAIIVTLISLCSVQLVGAGVITQNPFGTYLRSIINLSSFLGKVLFLPLHLLCPLKPGNETVPGDNTCTSGLIIGRNVVVTLAQQSSEHSDLVFSVFATLEAVHCPRPVNEIAILVVERTMSRGLLGRQQKQFLCHTARTHPTEVDFANLISLYNFLDMVELLEEAWVVAFR